MNLISEIKKVLVVILLTIMSFGCLSAQTNQRFDIIEVEVLKVKADSISGEYLEVATDFYGYSTVLQLNQDGKLTPKTFALDTSFRYSSPEGLGVDGSGITVTLDSSLNPDIQLGQVTKGRLPLKDNYFGLTEAINLFTKSYEDFVSEVRTVSLFHDVSMAEPVYVFRVEEGYIILGAISGTSGFMKQ